MRLLHPAIVLVCLFAVGLCRAELPEALKGARRILFLGDSITYAGGYVDLVETTLRIRNPEVPLEIYNLGLSSETVSGLSEEGHARGRYPRPHLHERLERVLTRLKPDVVLACYGMNDGIYHPLSEERFAKYREGIAQLRERVDASKARLILLTPAIFDPLPLSAKVQADGVSAYSYNRPFAKYDEVLTHYARWLTDEETPDRPVIDVHTTMAEFLADQRRRDVEFVLAKDGVHPTQMGHAVIAHAILAEWKLLRRNEVSQASRDERRGGWSVTLPQWLPLPVPDVSTETAGEAVLPRDKWWLTVGPLPATPHTIWEGETKIGSANGAELAWGINVLLLPDLSANRRTDEVLKFVAEKNALLRDAWLSEIGHKRLDQKPGLPVAEAEEKAADLLRKVDALLKAPAPTLLVKAE